MTSPASSVIYSSNTTPEWYKCDKCGATHVKLWREYNTFSDQTQLLCARCAAEDQKKELKDLDGNGTHISDTTHDRTDQIGYYIPAVPCENEDKIFWGYTSVPQPGVIWWKLLPTLPQ